MDSDEMRNLVKFSYSKQGEDDADDEHMQLHHPRTLSRLCIVCNTHNSTYCHHDEDDDDDDDEDDDGIKMFMSRFSLESFPGEADADEEFSNNKEEKEVVGCYSLPATPARRRGNRRDEMAGLTDSEEYATSKNEGLDHDERIPRRRRSEIGRERWAERTPNSINQYYCYEKNRLSDDEDDMGRGAGGRGDGLK